MQRFMIAGVTACVLTVPAAAQSLRPVIVAAEAAAGDAVAVEVSFLNAGSAAVRFKPPENIAADVVVAGTHREVVLTRSGAAAPVEVAPGGFISQRYTALVGTEASTLTLANGSAFAVVARAVAAKPVAPSVPSTGFAAPATAAATQDTGNAFLANLSAYAPIYAVYGPGTNTEARLQISFKYQLFGKAGRPGTWLDGFNFAYTQRLFWDLGSESLPFRNVDYNPELIYLAPAIATRGGAVFGAQAGIMHMSNGRDGTASRSFNTVYVQPSATVPIGDLRLTLGPRLTAYVGDLGDNPDLVRFRGNTGLFARIGTDDGWRLSTTSRINFGSGKGAIDAELTYPVNRLIPGVNLYAFGQGFVGYGENLLDYNRRQTRLRVGIGIVR